MAKTDARSRRVLGLLLASMLAASLVLASPVQAQSESGISTTQTVNPNPATVGQPLTFTVTVTKTRHPNTWGSKTSFRKARS